MGLGKLFGRSSSAGSTSSHTSSRSRGLDPLKLGPGSSKADYAFGLNQTTSPTSSGLSHSYYQTEDVPPAYSPPQNPGFNDFATDSKMSKPDKTQASALDFPNQAGPSRVKEDAYMILKNRDIIVILDDSHSMTIRDNLSGKTRWDQAWNAVESLVRTGMDYDTDGIRLMFLNQGDANTTIKTMTDLADLKGRTPTPQPNTYTPTGQVLDEVLSAYKRKTRDSPTFSRAKKLVVLVVTDGAATDDPRDVIEDTAKFYQGNRFPLDQVGIQFIQVGSDPQATEWLQELDTELKEAMGDNARDIVDTIMSDGNDLRGDALLKALTGAINRKQDRAGEKK